jgi:hypothetical protein
MSSDPNPDSNSLKTTSSLFQSQFGKNKLAKRVEQDRPCLLRIEASALRHPCHRAGREVARCVFRDIMRQNCGTYCGVRLDVIGVALS